MPDQPIGTRNEQDAAPASDAAVTSIRIRWNAGTWLLILALFYTAYFAKGVLIPIALAFLFNLLLAPAVRFLNRRLRIPLPVGSVLVVTGLLATAVAGFYALATPAADWMERLPTATLQIESKLRLLRAPVEEVREAARKVEELAKGEEQGRQPRDQPLPVVVAGPSLVQTLLGQTATISAGMLITIILLLFLLASGDTLLRQAISITPRLRDKVRIVEIARESEYDISHYLVAVTLINIVLGCAIGTAMWLLGVPNPLLWGVMAAIVNYIPYVGGLIGLGVIALVSVLTFDSLLAMAAPPLAYLVINGLEGQLVTPVMVARRLALNPVAVFLSLIVWSWLWGIAGALLAVPLLAAFKIICDRIEDLQPIGKMLERPAPPGD